MLDNIVFTSRYKHGDVLTTIDAQEAHKLRTVGVSWHTFLGLVKNAYDELMQAQGGFGPVRIMLTAQRQVDRDNVLVPCVIEIDIPNEFLTWPK